MSGVFRSELVRHSGSPESPVERIIVTVQLAGAEATISYDVIGDIDEVAFPEAAPSERRDGLWTATCFELFARRVGESGYREWNFAPSTAWAAYSFDSYRAGMRNADVAAPVMAHDVGDGRYRLTARATIGQAPWRISLSAIIRDRYGKTSYWALAHPPGKPDFHHADCFAAELASSKDA